MIINAIIGNLQITDRGDYYYPLKVNTNVIDELNKLIGLQVDVDIKKHHEKRSLNSNSYAWALINQIGDKLGQSKQATYEDMLKQFGQVANIASVVPPNQIKGFFKHFEPDGDAIVNGRKLYKYKVYVGSSEMDRREMQVFLNGIVDTAKELGIPTLDDLRIKDLIDEWE